MKRRCKHVAKLIYAVPLVILLGGCISIVLQLRQANLDSALISAIKKREVPKAISLLHQGASARAVDTSSSPPTMRTMLTDFWDRLRGKRQARSIMSGAPALMLACENMEREVWDANHKRKIKRSLPTHADQKLLSALLRHGADPNAWDEQTGFTALYSQVVAPDANSVKILLEAGASPNETHNPHLAITPLFNAVATHEYDIACLLLKYGAAVDGKGPNGMTALHEAMSVGGVRMVSLLLAYHADVDAQDDDGWTPLMYADRSRLEKIRLLIQHGARVSIEDNDGDTVLDRARQGLQDIPEQKEILRILSAAAQKEVVED